MDYKAQLVQDNLWIVDLAQKTTSYTRQQLLLKLCKLANIYTTKLIEEDFSFLAYTKLVYDLQLEEIMLSQFSNKDLNITHLILANYTNKEILSTIKTTSLHINRLRTKLKRGDNI